MASYGKISLFKVPIISGENNNLVLRTPYQFRLILRETFQLSYEIVFEVGRPSSFSKCYGKV